MRSIHIPLCTACQLGLVLAGQSYSQQTMVGWDDFRLPYAVVGEAERHIPPNDRVLEQQHTLRFESSRDWWRFELWVPDGSFGTSLMQFTSQDKDQSIHYSGPSRQGFIDDAFSRTGFASSESLCSPIGAVRLLVRAYDAGLPIDRTELEQNRTSFVWNEPATDSRFELIADIAAGTVLEVQRGEDEDSTRWTYLDWRPIEGDRHHPFRIQSVVQGSDGTFRDNVDIIALRALPASAKPSPYNLPPDAILVNRLNGTTATASGRPIETSSRDQNVPQPRPMFSARNLFIATAVFACAAAGLVTVLKRRGIM